MHTRRIADVDVWIQNLEKGLKIGMPFEKAFPRLKSHSIDRDFSEPVLVLKYLINWIWLRDSKSCSPLETKEIANEVVCRSLEVYGRTSGQYDRGIHDLILLSVVILIEDQGLLGRVASQVAYAEKTKPPVVYSEYCGMLKARLLGDKSKEIEQFDLRLSCKGNGTIFRLASRNTSRAFVAENEKVLIKHCQKASEEFWAAVKKKIFPEKLDDKNEFALGAWPLTAFWPWPEMVLLKLAFVGRKIPAVDDFWLPRQLLN